MINENQPEVPKSDENKVPKVDNETDKIKEEEQEPERLLVPGLGRFVNEGEEKYKTTKGPPPYKVVTREEWGAVPPTRLNPFRGTARSVRLIFTDSKPCRSKKSCIKVIQKLQRSHMRQGLSDIAYNFLIGGDIRVYEGRGWFEHPGITESSENYRTCEDIVIGYVGTFDDNIEYPEMADKAHEVIDYGYNSGYMAGDLMSTGGQAPTDQFAQTGIDVDGYPEPVYKCAYGV